MTITHLPTEPTLLAEPSEPSKPILQHKPIGPLEPTGPPSATARRSNRRSDVAEGVISTAIAVLVIAFLGLLMWVGFRVMFNSATTKANQTIEQIGN